MNSRVVIKRARFLAIASLAVGAAGWPVLAQDQPGASQIRSSASERAAAPAPDEQAASKAIARAVSAALNPQGDLRQLTECFYGPDRDRLEQAVQGGQAQGKQRLSEAVATLQRSFQEKYNQQLSLADASALGDDFVRVGGRMEEGARPAGGRIEGRSSGSSSSGRSSSSSSSSASGGATSGGSSSSDRKSGTGGTSESSSGSTASEKGSGTSGSGAAGAGASSAGPSSTTDSAGAARPTQGNIGSNPDRSSASGTSAQGNASGGGASGGGVSGRISGSGLRGAGNGATQGRTASGASEIPNSASATIGPSQGMPAVVVSLVREGGDWKINVPDTVTAGRLHENLARQLGMANQQREQWPDDAKQAQQAIAHRVMMAITGTEARAGGRGGAGAGNLPGSGNRRER